MRIPARNCTGTTHDFLRPNRLKKTASTMGAHRSLSEKGQEHKANIAFALYESLDADAAIADAEAEEDADAADAEDAAATEDVNSCIFCCIKNGIDADKPIGIP
mmetsp:Transcript_2091/g.2990  ORF Transcript_2091/g.2990 Transcript_2091/m.2990 type:complete len:104 (-) Transcript_2091:552-863(-)